MKQPYIKPRFAVELFSFSQSIANGCDLPPEGSTLGSPYGHTTKTECGWDVGGIVLFLDVETKCYDIQVGEDEQVMDYCYDNPDGGITIFASY